MHKNSFASWGFLVGFMLTVPIAEALDIPFSITTWILGGIIGGVIGVVIGNLIAKKKG